MKNTIKIATLLMIAGLFSACQQSQSTKQILADETQRKDVMQTIANNNEMMVEMMDVMMNSEHGKMMMSGNHEMMGIMKENPEFMQGMMQMLQNDSSKRNQMVEMMSGNHEMMQDMMGKMRKKGMINDDCYKNGMNMMGKGMMNQYPK